MFLFSSAPSDHYLADGATIQQTQSAFVLEDAIGQLINNSGSSNSSSKDSNNGTSSNSNCNCTDTNAAKKPERSAK